MEQMTKRFEALLAAQKQNRESPHSSLLVRVLLMVTHMLVLLVLNLSLC